MLMVAASDILVESFREGQRQIVSSVCKYDRRRKRDFTLNPATQVRSKSIQAERLGLRFSLGIRSQNDNIFSLMTFADQWSSMDRESDFDKRAGHLSADLQVVCIVATSNHVTA